VGICVTLWTLQRFIPGLSLRAGARNLIKFVNISNILYSMCVYVCINIYIIYIYIYICVCVCVCVCVCMSTCVCLYLCWFIEIYSTMYVLKYLCINIYSYYTHTNIHIHTLTHSRARTHPPTHIHTHTQNICISPTCHNIFALTHALTHYVFLLHVTKFLL
jgi:hypothetical protein